MAAFAFVIADYTGHLHSTFALARGLTERGHRVVYFVEAASLAKVRLQGYQAEAVPFLRSLSLPPTSGGPWQRLQAGRRAGAARLDELDAVAPAVADLVARWAPDLLIFDPFFLCYYIPFHPHRIPAVALSTKPLLDADPAVPPYTSAVVPGPSLLAHCAVRAAQARNWLQYRRYRWKATVDQWMTGYSARRVLARLSAQAGFALEREWLERPVSFDFCLRGLPELVLSARELDLPRARPLRANVAYLGPCVDLQRREMPFDWSGIERRKRLVFCSLGTVQQGRDPVAVAFLRRLIAALANDADITLLIATGDAKTNDALLPVPTNVFLRQSVPQLEILRHADVMITHGGSSSLKECISLGVLPLVYPRRADQPGNGARVAYHQLGLCGSMTRDGSQDIRRRLDRLLSDGNFRRQLGEMRRRFAAYEGVAGAILERYAKRQELPQAAAKNGE